MILWLIWCANRFGFNVIFTNSPVVLKFFCISLVFYKIIISQKLAKIGVKTLHATKYPAINYKKGYFIKNVWYLNGSIHRENGPALEYLNGDVCWYFKNRLHRENAPAVISKNIVEWWNHGVRHRIGGPAIIQTVKRRDVFFGLFQNKYWFQDGTPHRLDGPAVECANGHVEYWLYGKQFSKADFDSLANLIATKSLNN